MGVLDIVKRSKIHVFGIEKELLRSNNRKWVKYFSKLEKYINPQIQEVLQNPKRKNTKKTTSRYIIENFLKKIKDKYILKSQLKFYIQQKYPLKKVKIKVIKKSIKTPQLTSYLMMKNWKFFL